MVAAADTTAFPTLSNDQLERLVDYGDDRAVTAGTSLFVEGQSSYDLIVILDGEADIIYADATTGVETVIASHGAGRFLGELSLLTGQRTFLRGRMRTDGRIRCIPQTEFRRLLASDPEIGDTIFEALVARRIRPSTAAGVPVDRCRRRRRRRRRCTPGTGRRRACGAGGSGVRRVGGFADARRRSGRRRRPGRHQQSHRELRRVPVRRLDGYRLTLGDDTVLMARAVVIALGVQYRKLPLERLEEFEGAGVYCAATDLEARVCGTDPVTVIGGGNSAGQAAIFLAQQGSAVTIAIRGADLASSMSSYLIDRIEAAPNIVVSPYTEVVALHGDTRLAEITLRDNRSSEERRQACSGLFSFIGAVPFTTWLDGFVELDDKGFVLTDSDLVGRVPDGFEPLPFETSRPGVFAAGDVRASSMKRVAAAVGDGSSAIRSVHQRLATP